MPLYVKVWLIAANMAGATADNIRMEIDVVRERLYDTAALKPLSL